MLILDGGGSSGTHFGFPVLSDRLLDPLFMRVLDCVDLFHVAYQTSKLASSQSVAKGYEMAASACRRPGQAASQSLNCQLYAVERRDVAASREKALLASAPSVRYPPEAPHLSGRRAMRTALDPCDGP
jgi:hypothetical protein